MNQTSITNKNSDGEDYTQRSTDMGTTFTHKINDKKIEQRLVAELNVRNQLDQKFFNTKSLIRRSPERYMHNPTKVFSTTISSKMYNLYDLPGY